MGSGGDCPAQGPLCGGRGRLLGGEEGQVGVGDQNQGDVAVPGDGAADLVVVETLSLARKIGGCVLYLRSEPFDPYADEDDIHELPVHLVQHVGQVGQVSVAFTANGLVHFWQQSAAWYLDCQRLPKETSGHRGLIIRDEDDQPSAEERQRSEAELIDRLLADPEFRAAVQVPGSALPGFPFRRTHRSGASGTRFVRRVSAPMTSPRFNTSSSVSSSTASWPSCWPIPSIG